MYTDGLTDAPADQAVTVEELTALLEDDGDQPIEDLADSIRALKRHRRPLGSGDDTALLILRFEILGRAHRRIAIDRRVRRLDGVDPISRRVANVSHEQRGS